MSPDRNALGLMPGSPSPLRYENASTDPGDVALKLAQWVPEGALLLDVGCGTGSVTEVIARTRHTKTIAIEPDADRARLASSRGLTVHVGEVSEAFLAEFGPFEVIILADVLEHLPSPAGLLQKLQRALAPGGALLISVPNVAHLFVRSDLLMGRFEYQDSGIMDATHLRWFTKSSARTFLERLGFVVTHVDATVNASLPDYSRRLPWRWIRAYRRRQVIGMLVKFWPGLFGCQVVVRAVNASRADGTAKGGA